MMGEFRSFEKRLREVNPMKTLAACGEAGITLTDRHTERKIRNAVTTDINI